MRHFLDFLGVFKEAIRERRQIEFLYKNEPLVVKPYRIVHHHGCWYLAAVNKGTLRAYRLSRISLPKVIESESFEFDAVILKQLENEESIWFGQQKQELF